MTNTIYSFAIGLGTTDSKGDIIEVYYPRPQVCSDASFNEQILNHCDWQAGHNGFTVLDPSGAETLANRLLADQQAELASLLQRMATSTRPLLLCASSSAAPPASIPEAFLKLHLLSHRLARPHELNLDGIFGVLRNLAWTNKGAIDLDDLPVRQLDAQLRGELLEIYSVDKFPKMSNYIVPTGVRIADTARIRLGAYLGAGTTVMHEGFVNFNAGTEGTAMIEGRISAGVVVGEDSDLGGGCSTMGTLSGGGREIISVGKNCLIGANAGIGIPLADGCTVEAGLYVTAGTKVNLLDHQGNLVRTAKAREICHLTELLYRRNSLTGSVEAVPLHKAVALNEALHSNN